MEIGLLEFNASIWPSLERTRAFYAAAISRVYQTVPVSFDDTGAICDTPAAIVNFMGNKGWELDPHPNCPLIFGIHGGAILNQPFLRKYLGKLKTSDVLVVNCQSDIDILRNMFEKPPLFCHLPLPVDSTYFKPIPKEEARKKLSLQPDDVVLGFVGRLLPQKNLHRFLEFADTLKKSLSPVRVKGIIIGKYWVDYPVLNYNGEAYPQYIQSLITEMDLQQDLLYFPANLSNEDLATCYNVMDVLIHPTNSIDENFGYAPVEAMTCGTPVIGAAYGGLKDTVISGQTGFLMPTWITEAGIRMDTWGGQQFAAGYLSNQQQQAVMRAAALSHATAFSTDRCSAILCDSIAGAIAAYHQGATEQVILRPHIPGHATDVYLPTATQPWKKYEKQVSHYVSSASQAYDQHSFVYAAATVTPAATGGYILNDPTWPAIYPFDAQQQKIMQLCSKPVAIDALVNLYHIDPKAISTLLEIGALCHSQYHTSNNNSL